MLKAVVVAIFLACCLAPQANAQSQCIKDLSDIFNAEQEIEDFSVKRTYILCPNTRFEPGVLDEASGQILGGQFPLVLLENAHVKCGEDGSSANNCVIDGTGTYAMFLTPYSLFGLESAANIVVEGITVDFWVRSGQLPIIIAAPEGDITFLDCIFSNNLADPLFFIDEILFINPGLGPTATGRSGAIDGDYGPIGDQRQKPDFKPKFNFDTGDGDCAECRRRELGQKVSGEGAADGAADGDGVDIFTNATDNSRRLQVADLRVTFQGCLFDFNSPVRNAKTQAGLSVIRFRARNDPLNPNVAFEEYVGKMDARFIRNTFRENIFSFTGDQAVYRSLIDFYSVGRLILRQNCFEDSPVKAFGAVTSFETATVVNDRNWMNAVQPDLDCNFVAFLNVDYEVQRCGPNAGAPACRASTPTRAPSQAPVPGPATGGFACFPGDAHCQVEGQGDVLMQNVKLGDKVLVEGDKYEPVYSFGHYDPKIRTEFLRLITTGPPLEITSDHMLFVAGGRAVPAGSVKIGDELELAGGERVTVKSVRRVTKKGAYAPFTPSGTIIVNDLKASSFVAFQDSATLQIAGYDTGVSFQWCALAFEAPHRFWCNYVSSCTTEDYTAEGVSTWVAQGHQLFLWFFDQHPVVSFLLLLPTVTVFTMLTYPVTATSLLLGAIVVAGRRRVKTAA